MGRLMRCCLRRARQDEGPGEGERLISSPSVRSWVWPPAAVWIRPTEAITDKERGTRRQGQGSGNRPSIRSHWMGARAPGGRGAMPSYRQLMARIQVVATGTTNGLGGARPVNVKHGAEPSTFRSAVDQPGVPRCRREDCRRTHDRPEVGFRAAKAVTSTHECQQCRAVREGDPSDEPQSDVRLPPPRRAPEQPWPSCHSSPGPGTGQMPGWGW